MSRLRCVILLEITAGVLCLWGQGDFYQVRREIRKAAEAKADVALLGHAAKLEDISGTAAARAYAAWAGALEQSAAGSAEYRQALERGLLVSLRDGDNERATWFRERLSAVGSTQAVAWFGAAGEPQRKGIWIPGGLEALAFVARGKENSPPERFFAHYCRTIVQHTDLVDRRTAATYVDRLQRYFRRLAALASFGTRNGNRVTITLSFADRKPLGNTEKVLNLLGWRIRALQKRATMEADEKTAEGTRLESANALAVDGVALQEAFESGKPFSFDLPYEWAPVVVDEEAWRRQFYPKESLLGGLAEAVARDPRLARVYVGLSALDEKTVSALMAGIGLKDLVERYAALLYLYSPALSVERGSAAAPIWETLVGAPPAQPAQFFRALFEKDEGRLLAFFFTAAQLDAEHQRFLTQSARRLAGFYELFREAPELKVGPDKQANDSPLVDLLRAVPLDAQGRVRFPGGRGAWTAGPAKAGVEDDDEILLRLARQRLVRDRLKRSGLDEFLAVVRVDTHRKEALDEASARMLAERIVESEGAYSYFATLTGLSRRDFELFFKLRDKLRRLSTLELNAAAGQLHALIELLCLAQQSGAMEEKRSATLFRVLCERFSAAASPADWTRASLELVRQMTSGAADPDEAIREMLLGRQSPVSFELNGAGQQIDAVKIRRARYQRVLELQKVPRLSTLFELYDLAGDRAVARARLPDVEIPKSLGIKGRELKNLQAFHPPRIRQMVAGRQGMEKPSRELLSEMNPQVRLALAGIIYAYFLSPDDLPVSEDPLLLRKHQFVALHEKREEAVFPASDVYITSDRAGTRLTGGFANFPGAACPLAIKSIGGGIDAGQCAQIAALRATDWRQLRDEDLRLLGLKIRMGREWVLGSAVEPALASGLAEATQGLLSATRRGALLNGIRLRDWAAARQAVTLSDLYFLGDEYLRRYRDDPRPSPVTQALREATARNDGSRLQWLGASTPGLLGCSHPHLVRVAPYEEYQRYLQPGKIAERVAEFKLYLADYTDRAGIPAAALGALAEPLAHAIFQKLRAADVRDWQAVLAAFAELDDQAVAEVLGAL